MPSIRGEAVASCEISTDNTTANFQDLKTDLLQTLTYDKGIRTQERTRGGDAVARYERMKPDPSIELYFDPEVAANRAYALVMASDAEEQQFDIKIWAGIGQGNQGVHFSGLATVTESVLTYNNTDGEASIRVTLRPVGDAWTEDTDVS